MTLKPSHARQLCLDLQVTGEHVIVAKNTSSFANDQVPPLLTPLQPPQFLLKVAAHSSGPNLTQRSETKQSEYVSTTMKCQLQSLICSSIWKMFKNDARKMSSDLTLTVLYRTSHVKISSVLNLKCSLFSRCSLYRPLFVHKVYLKNGNTVLLDLTKWSIKFAVTQWNSASRFLNIKILKKNLKFKI